jgi:hypothetical protein
VAARELERRDFGGVAESDFDLQTFGEGSAIESVSNQVQLNTRMAQWKNDEPQRWENRRPAVRPLRPREFRRSTNRKIIKWPAMKIGGNA